jgi:aminoglycoside phosphotransferase (APT) family kinase protein
MLPPPIHKLAQQALGPIAHLEPTSGGFSNQSWYATIGDRQCVIKAATLPAKREDVRREALLLPLLALHRLPTPRLLAFVEDDDWSVAITERLPGQHGLALLADTRADLTPLYQRLGGVLAMIHQLTLPARRELQPLEERCRLAQAVLVAAAVPPALKEVLDAGLLVVAESNQRVLVHGDVGLHNLLWDGQRLFLLDWEWAAPGTPLLDLAWLRWTIQWRGLPQAVWQAFVEGYYAAGGSIAGLTATVAKPLMLAQIGLILARVADQPAAVAEWVRRGMWTLEHGADTLC